MLFFKSALAFMLVLITSAASQIIITETSTVTLITITSIITVQPPSTSTSTKYVTIGGNAPSTTQYYSTLTVTVTASQQAPSSSNTQCPVLHHGQCGGTNYRGCKTCAARHYCSKVNDGYSICHLTYAAATAVATVYKGDAL